MPKSRIVCLVPGARPERAAPRALSSLSDLVKGTHYDVHGSVYGLREIETLELMPRTLSSLLRSGVEDFRDLDLVLRGEWRKVRNFGKVARRDVEVSVEGFMNRVKEAQERRGLPVSLRRAERLSESALIARRENIERSLGQG